jgi:phosphoribosyl 1,2-cyclic phosphate phosphodiesterase
MTKLSITLLGTGTSQGIPVIGCQCAVCTSDDPRDKRTRTAAFVQAGETGISIDVGPDYRQQMLRAGYTDVHAVLLTHEHNDHTSGLDDLRPINFLHKRNIPVYGGERTLGEMRRRFYYAFDEDYQYPGKPMVHAVPMHDLPFQVDGVTIQPIPVEHGDIGIYGFRIGNVAYITDAKTIPASSMEKLAGLDILILNALRFRPHPTHLTVEEAIALFQALRPHRCYITHISHDMGLQADVQRQLPEGMFVGYDGLHLVADAAYNAGNSFVFK